MEEEDGARVAEVTREQIAARADLSLIVDFGREEVLEALLARQPGVLLTYADDNMLGLEIVWRNCALLKSLGIFEAELLDAYFRVRVNAHHVPASAVEGLFRMADRHRLLAAGSPLPGPGPFTLFRGVAGHGCARRVRGLSWTDDENVARWFANRGGLMGLKNPTVFRATVESEHVLAHITSRQESEFLVILPEGVRVERVSTGQSTGRPPR